MESFYISIILVTYSAYRLSTKSFPNMSLSHDRYIKMTLASKFYITIVVAWLSER
jgi:hypothetical protein